MFETALYYFGLFMAFNIILCIGGFIIDYIIPEFPKLDKLLDKILD